MKNKFLPAGSVVSLDGAEKKLLIIGSAVERENDKNVYDYIGVPYPEGYVDSETMFLFMAKDIKEVHFIGFVNAEAQVFMQKYADLLKGAGNQE